MHLSLRTHLRHGRRRGARASLLVAAPLALALAATPAQAASTTLDDYGCSSTTTPGNVFTVPSHVEALEIRVTGERGGGFGGMGAVVSGRMVVSPGERLYVCVGTGGGSGSAGGNPVTMASDGGGLSSVSRNEFNSGAFAIAGGGGGSGAAPDGGPGGDAGLLGDFARDGGWTGISLGGVAAGPTRAGAGGRYNDEPANAMNGTGGTSGFGGDGGNGSSVGGNGGGGGAGYWGGGGGSGSSSGGAAGGGGGSSYCNTAQVTDCVSAQATVAAPSVTFTYPDAPTPTTTTLTVTPDRLVSGEEITFATTISPVPDGGTVTITQTTYHINEECDNIPVGPDGRASCTVPASLSPGIYDIDADYSGTAAFEPSRDTKPLSLMYATQTLPWLTGSGTPRAGDPVTFVADVIPHPLMDLGTVDFTLDGDPIAACQEVAIVRAQARCDTTAPGAGRHTIGASYTGSPMYDVSTGRSDFTIAGAGNPGPGPGDPGTGNPGAGDPGTGNPGTGSPGTGNPGTGDPRAGNPGGEQPRTGTDDSQGGGSGGTASKPATIAKSAGGRAAVGRGGAVSIPLACPAGETCRVSGTLSVAASRRLARTSAASQRVIARFRGVAFTAGQTRALRLRLPAGFVREAQRSGARTVRATLTLTTVRGNGARTTTRQRITLVLPRAAAAPRPAQRPSFTG